MTLFFTLRHGQTDWNIEGRLQGSVDTPLNETGRQQARDARTAFQQAGITRIIVSPKQRCLTTMEILNEGLDLPHSIDERLVERHFGDYEGQYRDDVAATGANIPDLPSVEPWADTMERAHEAVTELLQSHPQDRLRLITHGGFISALGQAMTSQCQKIPNATLVRFERVGFKWRQELIGIPAPTPQTQQEFKR